MTFQIITKFARLITSAVTFLFLTCGSSMAGEIVEIITKKLNSPNAQGEVMQFLFSDGLMKMKDGNNDGEMVFNSNDQNMMVISHSDKSYMMFDQQTGATVKNEMEKAMEQALAQVPPEQRAMVEQMMKQRMQGMGGAQMPQMQQAAPPKTEIRKTSRGETINGYDCTYYEAYKNNQKESEYCVATWSELGASDNMKQSFEGMSEFMKGFLGQFKEMSPMQMDDNPFNYMNEIGGFPVLNRQFSNGQATEESTLSSITEQDIDSATFAAPAGYQQRSLMGM